MGLQSSSEALSFQNRIPLHHRISLTDGVPCKAGTYCKRLQTIKIVRSGFPKTADWLSHETRQFPPPPARVAVKTPMELLTNSIEI